MFQRGILQASLIGAVALVATGFSSAGALAQGVITRLDDAKCEELIDAAGGTDIEKVEISETAAGFVFMHDGLKHVMFVDHKTRSVQLFIGFEGDEDPSDEEMKHINSWSIDRQYGRAYIAKSGQQRLEIDLTYRYGVTEETLVALIEEFIEKAAEFQDFLNE